jgi:small GTP-binding protein
MSAEQSYSFKVVVMGESHVGKSSLIRRLCYNDFSITQPPTRGVADRRVDMQVMERNIALHIWDTAGQGTLQGINRLYYRNASGALLVFDITSMESFKRVDLWIKQFKDIVENADMILIGNKVDLAEKRQVSQEKAREFAIQNSILYYETSAKSDLCVTDAFNKLGEKILSKILCGGVCNTPNGLSLKKKIKTNKKCC